MDRTYDMFEILLTLTYLFVSYCLIAFQTTFILKRRRRVHLVKSHKSQRSRELKARHFLYDFVENVNVKKPDPIKLILKTTVEGVWKLMLDVVSVTDTLWDGSVYWHS